MTAADSTASTAPQPLLDLQALLVALRRRRRLWLFTGLLGVLAGVAVAYLLPAPPSAVTRVLVVHEQDGPSDGGARIRTDIALLETGNIAAAALKALNSPQRPEDFLKTYTAVGLSNNVLELTVKATSDQEAVARAQALAEAFIAAHVQRVQAAADAQAQALFKQRDEAQAELTKLDASIASTSAQRAPDTPAKLEALYARRAELSSQISDFGHRAEEAAIGKPEVAAGTQIVDAPRALPRSLLRTAVTDAAIGGVLGLVIGLMIAAVASLVRDRPIMRRDIAAHLGSSVIAELPAPRRGLRRLWRRSRAEAGRKRVAATLVRAIREEPASVSVLELGARRTAAALAMDMAEQLALDGSVIVVDDLPGHNLPKLTDQGSPIRIVPADEQASGPPVHLGQRMRQVGVGSVAPGTAWTDLEVLGAETILVVRAGRVNTAWLHTVARQLADNHIPIIGVVLVDADPWDRSDGTLWDGLHAVLRARSKPTTTTRAQVAWPRRDPSRRRRTPRATGWPADGVRAGAAAGAGTNGAAKSGALARLDTHPAEPVPAIGSDEGGREEHA